MSVRLDSLQSISLFFPQTTSRGKQAMILKNPADDLGIAIVGRGQKNYVKQTLWIKRYQQKLPVSLGPLYGHHLIQLLLAWVPFTHVTISTGPAKIIIIMPSSGMAIIGGHEHNLPIIISEIFPGTAVARSNRVRPSFSLFPKPDLTKSFSRSMQAT